MSLRDEVINRLSGPQPEMHVIPSKNGYATNIDTDKQYTKVSLDTAIADGKRRNLDTVYWQSTKTKQWLEVKLNKENK